MATPNYQGDGQPTGDTGGGWFGRFGSFFGGTTPAYQPAPAPKPTEPSADETTEATKTSGCGPIAIIVPRLGCVTEVATPQP
jgi:hypothetical protein